MKKLLFGLICFVWLVSSCASANQSIQTASVLTSATSTSSPLPTETSLPTATPTASITPLPTIPTFTSTFDGSTILTATPAPRTGCRVESPNDLATYLREEIKSTATPIILDVTNDGIPEIIINGRRDNESGPGAIYIYSCNDSEFLILDEVAAQEYPLPLLSTIQDLNKNGVPEIVIYIRECGGFGSCWLVLILEWNGEKFINLGDDHINKDLAPWLDNLDFKDIDNDGTIEVIIRKGLPGHPDSLLHGPWRSYSATYSWNGKKYVLKEFDIDTPQYRFQAVQDADHLSINGDFTKAISLYQDVIFDNKLEWWSKERYLGQFQIDLFGKSPTPTLPAPDSSEYPRLAVYAYYRIILLYFVQGFESDASTVYNTLQQKFGNDPYGRPYVEMATAFWNAYQSTDEMYDGCAAAIQYAVEHPDILIPLGSDYHGWQSKIYKPEDVCPFR